jgi:acetylornithine deacetylase/succinyl-diaminopimelate desuccinylase-like protein
MPLERYVTDGAPRFLEELFAFLRIPSISTLPERADDVRRAAAFVAEACERAGLRAVVHETAGHPIVVGRSEHVPGAPTVMLYGHYDVQPAEVADGWDGDPFEPRQVGDVIVARGANDDKGQVYAHIKGLETVRAVDGALPLNVIVLVEGEEEVGSVHLVPFIEEHRDALACDVIIVSDGTMAEPGRPSIAYGIRGSCGVTIEVRGARADLHSGNFGGAVPNAVQGLAQLVAGMKGADGRVRVEGFYDAVIVDEEERRRIARTPFSEPDFLELAGVTAVAGEVGFSTLERMWTRPTLELNGLVGGYGGVGSKTIIPATAVAKITCRLVPDQEPDDIVAKLRRHVERHAPAGLDVRVRSEGGSRPAVMDTRGAGLQVAARVASEVWGRPTLLVRGGGSIGIIAEFQRVLGVDPVLLGFGDKDDGIHGPNEKFGVTNYLNGIRTSARLVRALADMA